VNPPGRPADRPLVVQRAEHEKRLALERAGAEREPRVSPTPTPVIPGHERKPRNVPEHHPDATVEDVRFPMPKHSVPRPDPTTEPHGLDR